MRKLILLRIAELCFRDFVIELALGNCSLIWGHVSGLVPAGMSELSNVVIGSGIEHRWLMWSWLIGQMLMKREEWIEHLELYLASGLRGSGEYVVSCIPIK